MNFNENIKMTEKHQDLKSINKLISGPNYLCDTLLLSK